MQSKAPISIVIPPKGKRIKPILITGEFLESDILSQVKDQNDTIAKHLQAWGLKSDLNIGS